MNSKQIMTPLFTQLKNHAAMQPIPFHIPGHKGGSGNGIDPEFRDVVGNATLAIDLVSIEPLDDLHHPTGIIKDAQALAAEAFGADHSFFSVQGTSGAIMIMILSVCSPNDKIIVPRNVHKSILSAIVLSGAHPIFIHPEMDLKLGIAHGISVSSLEATLQEHPDAKAVLIINPTYYGVASDLTQLVKCAHHFGVPVLVDEAHGVLTYFHDDLPVSAMQAGADMAATSVHKLGGSLTQSSLLNMKKGLIDPNHVQAIISMLTTTSASYLLMSSLDTTRRHLAIHGQKIIEHTLCLARDTREKINRIPGLSCIGASDLNGETTHDFDETKLLIHLDSLKIHGHEVETWLRKHHRIEIELSDLYNILCLITAGDTEETCSLLIRALQDLSDHFYTDHTDSPSKNVLLPEIPELVLSPRDAFYSDTTPVLLEDAIGQVSAEFIMVYPPGIPTLIPGERISEKNVRYLQKHIDEGFLVKGTIDPHIRYIRVVT